MRIKADLVALHRSAILASVAAVAAVAVDDLSRPTPCAGWNLADLLTHMTAQHRGFAAAACGNGADPAIWAPAAVSDAIAADPAGAYAAAAADVLDAFAQPDVLGATFALPELGPGVSVPGSVAVGFHLLDYVVHAWDVACTLGNPIDIPADVVAAALPIAFAVPDGESRAGANALFAPAIPATDRADDLDRILAQLGRDPRWAAPDSPTAAVGRG